MLTVLCFSSYEGTSADYNKRDTNGITSTFYNVAGLRADTRYLFRLKAVNDKGESAPVVIEVKTIPSSSQSMLSQLTALHKLKHVQISNNFHDIMVR